MTLKKEKLPPRRTGGAYQLGTAAELLDISRTYLNQMIRSGLIETVEVGGARIRRIPDREIARILAEGNPAAQQP